MTSRQYFDIMDTFFSWIVPGYLDAMDIHTFSVIRFRICMGKKMIKTIKTDLPPHLTLIYHPISDATTATSGIKYCTEDASLVLVA